MANEGNQDDDMIEVKARCTKSGELTVLRVKKGTPMNEIFEAYARQKNHNPEKLVFKVSSVPRSPTRAP